jgi:hypothetical protein
VHVQEVAIVRTNSGVAEIELEEGDVPSFTDREEV